MQSCRSDSDGLCRVPPSRNGWLRMSRAASGLSRALVVTAALAQTANAAPPARVEAQRASVVREGDATDFILDLTQGVTVEVFTLSRPYRVIIDLPEVAFTLPADAGSSAPGLISNYRYGAYAEGRSRIVIMTTEPVAIAQAKMVNHPDGIQTSPRQPRTKPGGVQLWLRLTPMEATRFGEGTGAAREAATANSVKPSTFDDTLAAASPFCSLFGFRESTMKESQNYRKAE